MLNPSELLVNAAAPTANADATVTCVACGSGRTQFFLRDDARRIWRCRQCQLLFVFPQPTAEALDAEFQENYFRGVNTLETEFERCRRPVLTQIASEVHGRKPNGKLLDVGCASGELFKYFRADNWELSGVEPSATAFRRARDRYAGDSHIEVIHGYLRDVPQRSFDVITVLESLYYMSDPRRELANISRLLADDGLLAISLPGPQYQRLRYKGVISRIAAGRACSLTRSHLYYFSTASLTALLAQGGFSIIDSIGLVSPKYGGRVGQSIRTLYVKASRGLRAVTFGQIDLSLHILYLCRKSDTRSRV